jgi:hypothetical protein
VCGSCGTFLDAAHIKEFPQAVSSTELQVWTDVKANPADGNPRRA